MSQDLLNVENRHYASFWKKLAPVQAHENYFAIDGLLRTIDITERVIVERLAPYYENDDDIKAIRSMIQHIYEICGHGRTILYQAFTEAREDVIRAQMGAIEELSAPIVPIYRGVLIMPLIGKIDSQRTDAIIHALLESIAQQSASIVLLDITGVPIVDTITAHHIIQAAHMVRLLGAEIILVGIGPEIAQTVVQLGIDMSGIVTRADLQAGFAYALTQMRLQIIEKQPQQIRQEARHRS
ncbi:MAG: STAS domain-containing protein [Oscillochloris sp.]|nr:STAS domain-containing protein [Oscillochloris sp.]